MKTSIHLIILLFTLGFISCKSGIDQPEKNDVNLEPKNAIEYLSDKYILSIKFYDKSVWVYSSRVCDTCSNNSQLTKITDSNFYYSESVRFSELINDNDGNLYSCSGNIFYKINDIDDYSAVLETGDLYFGLFAFDLSGNIWICEYNEIGYWDKTELEVYSIDDLVNNPDLLDIYIKGLAIENSGTVWVPLDSYGILRIKSNNWDLIPYFEITGSYGIYFRNPLIDKENNIWFEAAGWIFDYSVAFYDGTEWNYCDEAINELNVDSEGTIWAIKHIYNYNLNFLYSTLSYFEDNKWVEFDISDVDEKVTLVNATDSKVYIGTEKGLYVKNK